MEASREYFIRKDGSKGNEREEYWPNNFSEESRMSCFQGVCTFHGRLSSSCFHARTQLQVSQTKEFRKFNFCQ